MPTQPPLGRSTPPAADPDQAAPSPARGLRWVYAPLSLLLLVPCYWQARVQAGGLSSPLYNSWLPPPLRGVYPPLSLLLLVPCYWQARVQAGDLSSHIYNSWLAQLIEGGRAPGLTIATQTTNVL